MFTLQRDCCNELGQKTTGVQHCFHHNMRIYCCPGINVAVVPGLGHQAGVMHTRCVYCEATLLLTPRHWTFCEAVAKNSQQLESQVIHHEGRTSKTLCVNIQHRKCALPSICLSFRVVYLCWRGCKDAYFVF